MPISERSPHLAKALKRYGFAPPLGLLDDAFDFSIQHGGELELDFDRPEDSSYNPRPARIALLVLNDGGECTSELITAAILATVPDALAGAPFPQELLERAMRAQGSPAAVLSAGDADAGRIAVALFLDRARHLHQANRGAPEELWRRVFELSADFVTLAGRYAPRVTPLLEHWRTRFARRIEG